ncbi:mitochondrial import receptor subunit TOM6 homolog [Ammospiza nelsoni]|uniref:mitochondrial import receptor subunit TOM6 homolog n=1 Tax=Melozone crissalis TaxID=40204 RepID=UPI0023DB513D|nr:mitochondrial import receptor subunit TOM6 homolog [Melozone crissalis]XP_057896012.1 mitochondrial import receptor subunit TOM6 homolog [Melospiza georgiana]XP_058675500.1 mitochondrial import receptor subunit TOM6 homolog [Ammospiza caudacuta]XP_058675501.1 mitochondrial import receptor subunit TOM6 homolog [Ammospiza caudacuta]XP_059343946.1 mitochondrial import receptor subunit TOM6 homolog [Ammospiza nelsoni]XP_059343948.1 mitochondrial import receptor subunit TOM6 homolog [Ammospiza n
MAAVAAAGAGAAGAAGAVAAPPRGIRTWLRSAFRFATDRNDFRRNLLLNLGLFAAGVWVARNLTDIDLMAPQPVP